MQNFNSKFKTDLNERCFQLSLGIIKLLDNLPSKTSSKIISSQIIRSMTSIGANLTEAKASSSGAEFKKFYEIALKSANESKYWLRLLVESELITRHDFDAINNELEEITKMIAAGVLKLKQVKF